MTKPDPMAPEPLDDLTIIGDWVECWNCGGEGEIEDEDWQFAGEFYTCDICEGKGGWPLDNLEGSDLDV